MTAPSSRMVKVDEKKVCLHPSRKKIFLKMVGMHRDAFADITGKTGRKEKSNSQREEKVSFLQSCGGSVRGGIPSTHLPRPVPAPAGDAAEVGTRDWLTDRRRIDEKSAVKDEILTGARKWGEGGEALLLFLCSPAAKGDPSVGATDRFFVADGPPPSRSV